MGLVASETGGPSTMLMPLSLTAAVAILGITAIWTLAVPLGPEVCALSMPGPRNCFVHDRAAAAIVGTVAIALLGAVITLIAILSVRSRHVIVFVGPIALFIGSVVAFLSAAWIPAWAFPWLN